MEYNIKQASEATGLSIYTLRYYDKEGLLPQIKRTPGGIRRFSDNDIAWIKLICCLKSSGMPISKIKEFMNLCLMGNSSCEERRKILVEHKKHIEDQLSKLNENLDIVNHKIDHYKEIGIFHIDA